VNRNQYLEKAKSIHFDLCIIGGGATGAGCALEAASRGMQTILIEKEDFAAGTSSKSTKLIHGGVRYLEQAVKKFSYSQYLMVRKALRERKILLEIAPHATRPLALLTPCRTLLSGLYYFIGLKLYDRISGNRNLGHSRLLSKKKALEWLPMMRSSQLQNAVLYYDGQMDDQRLNIAIIQTAAEKGAVCLNHCKAIEFVKNVKGKLQQLRVEDQLSGEQFLVTANVFINACGPFADAIRLMANNQLIPRIRVSRGVHLLFPKKQMDVSVGLLIPETKDGRVIFVLPYGDYLLAGTTDEEVPLEETEFGPSGRDVEYILGYVNEWLSANVDAGILTAGFGGFRPLVAAEEHNTKDLVRDHFVEKDNETGLVSILGGKWTTFRLMANDTVNAAALMMGRPVNPYPVKATLVGSRHFKSRLVGDVQAICGASKDIAVHLVSKYGDRTLAIAELMKDNHFLAARIHPTMPYTRAELIYVVENEMACTVKDVLNRKWGVEITNWAQTLELIPVVGALLADHFTWNEAQKMRYIHDYALEVIALAKAIKT
jgi:glycerol-3-phosphate dehydrogenase